MSCSNYSFSLLRGLARECGFFRSSFGLGLELVFLLTLFFYGALLRSSRCTRNSFSDCSCRKSSSKSVVEVFAYRLSRWFFFGCLLLSRAMPRDSLFRLSLNVIDTGVSADKLWHRDNNSRYVYDKLFSVKSIIRLSEVGTRVVRQIINLGVLLL